MKTYKYFFSWIAAFLLAFLLTNIICFTYERQPGWRDTPSGASTAVREPYAIVVHGTEGYSITRVDSNGYINPDKELAESYVLMMGSSHTQGKEIDSNKKYSVLVNEALTNDDKLRVYNISSDGSFLPSQLKHFKAATQAFSNAYAITIEIPNTDFDYTELEECLEQSEYDPVDSALYFENMPFKAKVKNYSKSYLPMLSKIKKNIETLRQAKADKNTPQIDIAEYEKVINENLALIRSECDVPIVFIYHPGVSINPDGTLSLNYSQTWNIFKAACEKNGIDVIDSGDDFLKNYKENGKVPYGFMNTSLGGGHLNEVGHRIIADEIIAYLEELQ